MNEELQRIAERLLVRRSMPLLDERKLMLRVERKVIRAMDRLGRMPSPGAQAVTRCNGVLRYEQGKLVVETGALAVVEAIPETWRTEPKELVN